MKTQQQKLSARLARMDGQLIRRAAAVYESAMRRATTPAERIEARENFRAIVRDPSFPQRNEMQRSTVGVPGPIARVNALLKKAGRDERVIRGRGYMYLIGGVGLELGSIYAMNLEATEKDFEFLRAEVNDKLTEYYRYRPTLMATKI